MTASYSFTVLGLVLGYLGFAFFSHRLYPQWNRLQVAAVACVGFWVLSPLLVYPLATALGFGHWAVGLSLALGGVLLGAKSGSLRALSNLWKQAESPTERGVFLALALLLGSLGTKILFAKNGGWSTAHTNAYGDLGWHVANLTAFAEGQFFPPQNPELAGTRLVYPFLPLAQAGWLLKSGFSLATAVVLPQTVLLVAGFYLFFLVVLRATRSNVCAVLALALLLCAGNTWGFEHLPTDFRASGSGSVIDFFLHLPRLYAGSSAQNDLPFLSPLWSSFIPQRNLAFGFSIAMLAVLFLQGASHKWTQEWWSLALLCAVLPLFHTHTVIALAPVFLVYACEHRDWPWKKFFLCTLAFGAAPLVYFLSSQKSTGAISWYPGWMKGQTSFLLFWFKNTGVFWFVFAFALFKGPHTPARTLGYAAAALFTAASLFKFAPWEWDNYRLFLYAFALATPLVAQSFLRAWRQAPLIALKLLVALCLGTQCLSGALDLWRLLLPTAPSYQVFSSSDVKMAERIQDLSPVGSVVLGSNRHNSPIVLSGRFNFLGYPGHLWTHGEGWTARERAVQHVVAGAETAEVTAAAPKLLYVDKEDTERFTQGFRPSEKWKLVEQIGSKFLYLRD